ncbi:hypothetical protein RF11_08986 [Thelohanellus kitauei]|uniref:Uncharacterized protein n=1 Tax=Thelohanellus kitauei TaxID=669202 RepID=A0A0C2MEH5_THEKT|nr:hypothetical protein RF11_08986 [Thelohanellus kitauei]
MLPRQHKYKQVSEDVRKRGITFLEANPDVSITEAANTVSINQRTLNSIFIRRTESMIGSSKGYARNTKVKKIHLQLINEQMKLNPMITLFDLFLKHEIFPKSLRKRLNCHR